MFVFWILVIVLVITLAVAISGLLGDKIYDKSEQIKYHFVDEKEDDDHEL